MQNFWVILLKTPDFLSVKKNWPGIKQLYSISKVYEEKIRCQVLIFLMHNVHYLEKACIICSLQDFRWCRQFSSGFYQLSYKYMQSLVTARNQLPLCQISTYKANTHCHNRYYRNDMCDNLRTPWTTCLYFPVNLGVNYIIYCYSSFHIKFFRISVCKI